MEIHWRNLTDAFENGDVPDRPGIYVLRWAKEGTPVKISRLGGVDERGILYVGSSSRLVKRLKNLKKALLLSNPKAHTIQKTALFCKIRGFIDVSDCQVAWEPLETHLEAGGQEWNFLKIYSERYHEPPPLNLYLRRKMFTVLGMGVVGQSRLAYEPSAFVKELTK